ncbi:MAG TPA: carboxymuconolactone decarboxylase family protein [Acidobacteriota bacterium]|nr:carboxymuconolactone decarboxylase family protein [Acidobacteriota bacterium]
MKPRINYHQQAAEAVKGLRAIEEYVYASGLEKSLIELVKLRVSQINGCAYCIDMHTKDARQLGETEQRLYLLTAWRETPFYSERERAALAWAEILTLISGNDVSDEEYEAVRQHFSESELIALTMAIVSINGWNRLAIPFRSVPGSYQPKSPSQA